MIFGGVHGPRKWLDGRLVFVVGIAFATAVHAQTPILQGTATATYPPVSNGHGCTAPVQLTFNLNFYPAVGDSSSLAQIFSAQQANPSNGPYEGRAGGTVQIDWGSCGGGTFALWGPPNSTISYNTSWTLGLNTYNNTFGIEFDWDLTGVVATAPFIADQFSYETFENNTTSADANSFMGNCVEACQGDYANFPGATTSICLTVTGAGCPGSVASGPSISGLSPSSITAGATGFTLTKLDSRIQFRNANRNGLVGCSWWSFIV